MMPDSYCLDEGRITLSGGIVNTFADLLVTVQPIFLITTLDLPPRRRFGAIVLVSLGFVVCIAGSVRAYYTWRSLINSYDETWECYGMWLSGAVEIDLGVVSFRVCTLREDTDYQQFCACAPALRIIFVRVVNPSLSQLSGQLGSLSPFPQKGFQTKSSSSSDPQSFIFTESSKSKRHSSILREKGFIITRGVSGTKSRNDYSVNSKEASDGYVWDEPWTGSNGPRPTIETAGKGYDDETATRTSDAPTTAEYGTAKPLFLTRTTSKTIMNNPPRRFGAAPGVNAPQARGFGILPDPSNSSGTTEDEDDDKIEVSSSDDLHLVFQGSKRPFKQVFSDLPKITSSHHSPSIGFPSITATNPGSIRYPRSPPPTHSRLSSRAEFDFAVPNVNKLRKPRESGRGEKTFSWLDDVSRESFAEEDEREGMGRERVRSWKLGRRGEEMGWDGAI
jgi:hypothetical protein